MNGSVPRVRIGLASGWLCLALLATAVVLAGDDVALTLRLDPSRLAALPPELLARLKAEPFVYFRFVNREWAAQVCAAFRNDLHSFPPAILHGDAHIEQYAITATARGLDDFDDAAHGPSVVDIVRFLGSVDVMARRRGWVAERERLFGSFFDGYYRALSDPAYSPPDPAVVTRVRSRPARTREEFFAWSESLMQPLTQEQAQAAARLFELLDGLLRTVRPELSASYLHPKKTGVLRIGVGSALARKFLARVEGPTASPDDDVLIEAKELSRLANVPCLQVPLSGEVFRVKTAAEQIGRLRYDIFVVLPRRQDQGPEVRDWWVRSWDETYREVTVADLERADELAELARDAGAQLGAANLRDSSPALQNQLRQAELAVVHRLEPRIRATARRLTDALFAGWEELNRQ